MNDVIVKQNAHILLPTGGFVIANVYRDRAGVLYFVNPSNPPGVYQGVRPSNYAAYDFTTI